MLPKKFLACCHIVSSLVYFSMGSRANTIEHTKSLKNKTPMVTELEDNFTKGVAIGVIIAWDQCRHDFRWERWNCTEMEFSRRYMNPVNREMAYVASITAAGIAYSVARSCAQGKLFPECKCTKNNKDASWEKEGCSVDLKLGQKVARLILGDMEGEAHDITSRVNRHNYEIGIKAIELQEGEKCKCHGISGSCTTRTCWGRVAQFPRVGRLLKASYRKAVRVAANRDNDMNSENMSVLLFLENSPDYCKPNATLGWEGTEGRVCSRRRFKFADRSERRSCNHLCRSCGHQVRVRQVETK
ncbi:protein Wnt-8a-like, partial [Halyomorpha halys]|uniref:protein Wnt-8a-like n=1 Tax=Halyomorpha halys TaxID=286706 RepID=UPI0034D2BB66